jgi:uncharacterized protein involved in type VI secretion and phage assembly
MTLEADLLAWLTPPMHAGRIFGVVIGVVTNNKDPDKLGRVKVKFPWLSDQYESNWARITTAMAGNQRGFYWLPEIDDEVLVAFEHGQVEFPYLLGALWNGKDNPIEKNDDGKNNLRIIRSRSGHKITLDDADGKEKIEIVDKSEKNKLIINTADNMITIVADKDISITATNGKLTLSGNDIEINSKGDLKVDAKSSVTVKATSQMTLKGSTININ